MKPRQLLAFFIAAATLAVAGRAYALTPVNLTVDSLRAPLHVDSAQPQLGWQIVDERRGAMATEWQTKLRSDAGPVWDSGKMVTPDFQATPPDGLLQSRTRYFWSVTVTDQFGNTASSDEATFVTGVLRPEDWHARWIWEDNQVQPTDYAYFSKKFDLTAAPAEAIALVSAHNFYVLYVNGKRVGGLANPATSNPYFEKYYLAYDLAPFLKPGENRIDAVCQYKGAGGNNYIDGVPGFLFEAKISLLNDATVWIATGPDWKTRPDTAWDERAPYHNHRRHTHSEYYHAGREPEGWPGQTYDPAWRAATVVEPGYKMRAQYLPESHVDEVVTAKKRRPTWAGTFVYDFGREYGGIPLLRVPSGKRPITAWFGDRLIGGRIPPDMALNPTLFNFDQFTPAGRPGEWSPLFGYRGFRYVEVGGWPGIPALDDVKLLSVRNNLPRTATFACSNPLFNQIYEASVHTLELGMIGQLIDCVHREQTQWHADAEMQAEAIFLNFNNHQLVAKALRDLAAGQLPSGHFPANYPANDGFRYNVVEWDLHYVPMLWKTWAYYQDQELLKETEPAAERVVEHYLAQVDETGLVVNNGGRHISDWPPYYRKVDQDGKYLTVQNLLFYHNLRLASRILGDRNQRERWTAAADRMSTAINRELWDEKIGAYIDCSGSKQRRPGISALALHCDIVPKNRQPQVIDYIERDDKIFASIYLTYFGLDALYRYDQGAFVNRIINSTNWPGWGYMIKKGDGTVWEDWTNFASRAHPFNAHLAATFIKRVVGIDVTRNTIMINPHLEGLDWARAAIDTPRGRVSADWRREGNALTLALTVPAGSRARVFIPGDIRRVTEGGTEFYPGGSVEGVSVVLKYPAGISLDVQSGKYSFRVE